MLPTLWPARAVILAFLALVTASCGADDPRAASTRSSSTTAASATSEPSTSTAVGGVELSLTQIGTFSQPVDLTTRPGDPDLYIAEKTGYVRALRDGSVDPTPVLDVSGQVSTGGEQGLLGIAFSPDGGLIYADFTDTSGATRVFEYPFSDGRATTASGREIISVPQPYPNHNGGQIKVTSDGMLWIALGDGGAADDPENRAQNLGTLLGKILRVDPVPSAGRPYTIPPDNPFVGQAGARAEIWSYGLRNPWRFSFDRATGDLWIGDVGQSVVEEIDFAPASSSGGENWGWRAMEGTRLNIGARPADAVDPIHDYARSEGRCSVTGGYVYRGSSIPDLVGTYMYGDYCFGDVRALRQSGGRLVEDVDLGLKVSSLSSFGQDSSGELYALSLDGPVYRIDP